MYVHIYIYMYLNLTLRLFMYHVVIIGTYIYSRLYDSLFSHLYYIHIYISIYLSIYLWASPKNLTYPKWTFPKHYCLFWFFKFWIFSRYVLYEAIGNCWRFSKQITFFQCETWSVKSCEHFAQLYVGAMWPNTLHRMSYCRISTHMKLCD